MYSSYRVVALLCLTFTLLFNRIRLHDGDAFAGAKNDWEKISKETRIGFHCVPSRTRASATVKNAVNSEDYWLMLTSWNYTTHVVVPNGKIDILLCFGICNKFCEMLAKFGFISLILLFVWLIPKSAFFCCFLSVLTSDRWWFLLWWLNVSWRGWTFRRWFVWVLRADND